MNIVKYISSTIENGRRILKILRNGRVDAKTANESMPFGVDSVPPADYRGIYLETQDAGRPVLIGYINIDQLSVEGETRLFSVDNAGNLSIDIKLRTDKTIEIGGDTDFMVRFSVLESAFNELKQDFNTFITLFNAHNHPTAPTGPVSPPATQGSQSTADISGAKISEVKTI